MGKVHGAPNNYNNSIKDHLSQIIITNIIKMKRFKILPELPKCNTETQSEQMLLEKMVLNRLACHRVATKLHFVWGETKRKGSIWEAH